MEFTIVNTTRNYLRRYHRFILILLLPLLALFFVFGPWKGRSMPVSSETWTGGDNNDSEWKSNGNWSGIGGAGANDDLVFPQSAARKNTSHNNFDVNTNFNSLTFTGQDYNITGNQIFLANGINTNVPSGAGNSPVFSPNIVLGSSQTWDSTVGFVELNGVINLNGHQLTLSGAGSHRLDGAIVGTTAGSFMFKNGSGSATFFGNSPNTSGINLDAGTLNIGAGAVFGNVVNLHAGTLIGNGTVRSINGDAPGFPDDGIVAPGQGGNTTGILTVNLGEVTFASTSTFA